MDMLHPSWRGKNISTRQDSRGKYTAMVGPESMLYLPVNITKNSIYKITLEMAKKSGNGLLYCNIYGNKHFDFPHAKLICEGNEWASYSFNLKAGAFPKTVPVLFRIWRKPGGTGSLLIRCLKVELLESNVDNIKLTEEPDAIKGLTPVERKEIGPVEKPRLVIELPDKETQKEKDRRQRRRSNANFVAPQPPKKNSENKLIETPSEKPKSDGRGPEQSNVVNSNSLSKIANIGKLEPGENGIKNSVIISTKNRKDFLNRTLYTYANQTMSKEQFEIVLVDDGSTQDLLSVCKKHASLYGLQFQYIRVDTKKGAVPQKGFTPALTNNIGFKHARGSVLIVTGPETLQNSINMEQTWKRCHEPKAIYGYVYKSGPKFVDVLKSKEKWYEEDFDTILTFPSARETKPSTAGFWWYYVATRKEYIIKMHGVDERYMQGICGEDDDFANRLSFLGLKLEHDKKLIGIHQNHTREDRKDKVHNIRFNRKVWRTLRNHNLKLLQACKSARDPIANKNIDWGTEEAIVDKEIF